MGRNIQIDIDTFEHILNCMCNQKYLYPTPEPENLSPREFSNQQTIDQSWNDGMKILNKERNKNPFFKHMKYIGKKLLTGRKELG